MKKIIITSAAFILALTLTTSCKSNGNTGNGTNDPTLNLSQTTLKNLKM